jgi:hypothetical protein
MASRGQSAAGIAHEIKNRLNFVNNFAGPLDELRQAAAPAVALLADDMRREIDQIVATPRAISQRLSSMAAEPTASSRACCCIRAAAAASGERSP